MYTALDLNFDSILLNRNDCEVENGTICNSKETFDPSKSNTSKELFRSKRGKPYSSSYVTLNSPEYGIHVTGLPYSDKMCLSPTSEGCVAE